MTGRNPRYRAKHPPNACDLHRKEPPLPPALRAYQPLQPVEPMTYMARAAHYERPTIPGPHPRSAVALRHLTPAQQGRLDAKAHRLGTREQRMATAAADRSAAIFAAQRERDEHLLGRRPQLPVLLWAKSAKAALRSGHRG